MTFSEMKHVLNVDSLLIAFTTVFQPQRSQQDGLRQGQTHLLTLYGGKCRLYKSTRAKTTTNLDMILPPNPNFQAAQTETLPEHCRLLFSCKSDIRRGTVVCEISALTCESELKVIL